MDRTEIERYAKKNTTINEKTIVTLLNGTELYGYFDDNLSGNELQLNNQWIFFEYSKEKRIINGSDILSIRTILLIDNKIELLDIRPSKIPDIAVYKKILGYQVYRSTVNENLFMVYDNRNRYYIFLDRGSNEIEKDLTSRIAGIFLEA